MSLAASPLPCLYGCLATSHCLTGLGLYVSHDLSSCLSLYLCRRFCFWVSLSATRRRSGLRDSRSLCVSQSVFLSLPLCRCVFLVCASRSLYVSESLFFRSPCSPKKMTNLGQDRTCNHTLKAKCTNLRAAETDSQEGQTTS